MKAGHSKLDGYSATLPAMRPSPRLPTVVAPLPPPPSSLLCAHTYVPLPTAEPPQIPAPQDCAQESRAVDIPAAAPPLPPPSPCGKLHGPIPRPCPLPRPEHPSYLHPPHPLHPVPPQPPLHRIHAQHQIHPLVPQFYTPSQLLSPSPPPPSYLSQEPQPHLICKHHLFPSP
jgi:hypothetical protein